MLSKENLIVAFIYNQIVVENVRAAASTVHQLSFSFCYREANNVAHRLDKWVSSNVCSNVWLDSGPSWITDVVFSDSSN